MAVNTLPAVKLHVLNQCMQVITLYYVDNDLYIKFLIIHNIGTGCFVYNLTLYSSLSDRYCTCIYTLYIMYIDIGTTQ